MAKYRVVKRGKLYYPEYRWCLIFWNGYTKYDGYSSGFITVECANLEEALSVIRSVSNRERTKDITVWEGEQ